jgi:hypothetical protein
MGNFKLIEAYNQTGVFWIYGVIHACLTLQIFLVLYVWYFRKSDSEIFSEKISSLSEWAINVPPTFGVLGTIVAMAFAISDKSSLKSPEAFMEAFMQNFQIAVSTTVIGGIIYALNLGLNSLLVFLMNRD